MSGQRIFDANRHVVEPDDLWGGWAGTGGRPLFPLADEAAQGWGAEGDLASMDAQGVDVALMLPTTGLYVPYDDRVGAAAAAELCARYNDWLAGRCSSSDGRMVGAALVPLQTPRLGAEELRRATGDLGLVAGVVRSNPVAGRRLHHRAYDVLYDAAESLGAPLVVTQAAGSTLPEAGADRFDDPFAREAVAGPFEMMLAFLSFMGHNVLERYPGLRVGFAGAGCGWLPYFAERADEHWGGPFGKDCPSTLPPEHLFRSQGFCVADPWETTVGDVMAECGPGAVVWGSQFPLAEAAGAEGRVEPAGAAGLADADRQRLLWDNAAALFLGSAASA